MNDFIGSLKEPRYVQVSKALLGAIRAGQHPVGSLLPHEAALCEQYGVSRTTVREALRQLSEEGVVNKLHGIGTVVRNTEPRSNFVVAVNTASSMHYGKQTVLTVIDRHEFTTDASHVRLLGCALGESWIRVRGLRCLPDDTDHPISLLEVYIPARYASVANEDMIGDRPYYRRILEKYQTRLVGIEQEIQAVSIGAEAAAHLRVKANEPGLYVIRHFLDPEKKRIQVSINTHPSERFSYHFYLNQAGS